MNNISEKPRCESCGKSFSNAGNLKRHTLTVHIGNKGCKCNSCGKSFRDSGYLKTHIHTQFMKVTKITNVNLVVDHLLKQEN